MQAIYIMFLLLWDSLLGVTNAYSYWDSDCSFVYEANSRPNFCSPGDSSNTHQPLLNHPCGFPLTAPLSGYCQCENNLVLAFCPQNVQDPTLGVPYQRSCQQLCASRLDSTNQLTDASFSSSSLWQNASSGRSNPMFKDSAGGKAGVTSCAGICQMNFDASYNAIGIDDPNLQYELRFSAYSENNASVSFCPPAYRPDVEPDCVTIALIASTTWQSYVIAGIALSNPGIGPFLSNSNVIREGFSFLIQASGRLVSVDDLNFWVTPEPEQVLVANQFASTASASKPEPSSLTGPSSINATDVTPAVIIGNSSEHDIDIYYCRALFFEAPNLTSSVNNFVTYYSDFELSSWEASHYHVSGSGTGIENGLWTLTPDEIGNGFVNRSNTVSCTSPSKIFNETNSYLGMTTLCHAALCDTPCRIRGSLSYDYDEFVYNATFTFAAESVATCQVNYEGQCDGSVQGPFAPKISFSKRVNPLQDNTLNVSQRSNYTSTKPFAIPHPLRVVNSTIANENYVYIGLDAPFRLRATNFLGFYSSSVRNLSGSRSLGFATVRDYDSSVRTDANFSVLRQNQAGMITVDVVHNGISLQCFGQHVRATQATVNNACHPTMNYTFGYNGTKNRVCTAYFDDPATCIGSSCSDPQHADVAPFFQDPLKAVAFDSFQCQEMCTTCGPGWLDNPLNGTYRASPRGQPANADLVLQTVPPSFDLCLPCPGVTQNYTPAVLCSGSGTCQRSGSPINGTFAPICVCKKDALGFFLWAGNYCEISAENLCNYGPGNSLGGYISPFGICESCNTGYTGPSCYNCTSGYYRPVGFPRKCVKCDDSTCDPRFGVCADNLTEMPWGGGCLLKAGVRVSSTNATRYECVASYPSQIIAEPNCTLCNPELSCSGQSCNADLLTLNGALCICDAFHTGADCSICINGYYGPNCLPCPSTCRFPNGNCSGSSSLASAPCKCNASYSGPYCQYSDVDTCNGHGKVSANGVCACRQDLGWSGTSCDECAESNGWYLVNGNCQKCDSGTCNGHGVCAKGLCSCDVGFNAAANCSTCLPNYYPAGVCATMCTNSVCSNHGTCDANGQCNCANNFAGKSCDKCANGYWLSGSACVACGGNPPCGGSGVGVCSLNGTCQCNGNYRGLGCIDPVITGVQMALQKVYVFGSFLALASYVQVTGVGSVNCTITNVSDHLDCNCPSLTPDGTWSYSVQVFTTDGKLSQVFVQAVPLPMITNIGPVTPPIPTAGGVNITLTGSNFGLTGGVVLMTDMTGAQVIIPLLQQTDAQIIFSAGAGVGVSMVRVKIGNTTSQNAVSVYYLPPIITSVSGNGSTQGQANVLVQGHNFGLYTSLASVVFENGAHCIVNSNCAFLHDSFCCSSPPGFGKVKVSLTIASLASTEVVPQYFVYDAPKIASVTGCSVTTANGTANCDPLGGTRIAINGTNFGDVLALAGVGNLTVLVGGAPCSNLILVPHVSITCALPSGVGTFNIVQVVRTGRINQVGMAPLVSYAGPSLLPLSIKIANVTAASTGSVLDTSTKGGLMLSFRGQGFSTVPANLQVRYGPASSFGTIGWQNCSVSAVTPTAFNCTTPPGVGKNLVFRVTLQNGSAYSSSDLSSDVYSYPAPTLTSGRLGNSFASRSASYTSQVANGELIYMSGTFLGTQPALVKVFYGPMNSPCAVQTVNETELSCIMGSGSGMNYTFRVEVGYGSSMQAANGSDQFNFPAMVPVIISVVAPGCGSPPNACPTDATDSTGAPIVLTINGTNLGRVYQVLIGDQACKQMGTSDTLLTCYLPKGVGQNRQVLLATPNSRITATTLVSYAAPLVTGVSGCSDQLPNTFNCARIGGMRITVRGTNFGAAGARVLVGGQQCLGVAHNSSTMLTCLLPPALSSSRTMMNVLQSGQLGASTVYVVYMACLPGFEDQAGVCVQCSVGSFSMGSQCVVCDRGSVAPSGASACSLCEIGKFSEARASACSSCAPGRSTMALGQSECEDCVPGRYSAGDEPCFACPPGTTQANLSAACSVFVPGLAAVNTTTQVALAQQPRCLPGTFASSAGASMCDLCAPGKYSAGTINYTAPTACTNCEAGRFQQSAGQSSCEQCSQGLSSTTASTKCQVCPVGRFGSALGTSCSACAVGTYAPISGLRECLACQAGKYGNSTGLVLCIDCPVGQFSNNSMQTMCMLCPSMSFADYGATMCTRCDFQDSTGQPTCVGCVPGRYLSSNMTCSACSAGKATESAGQTRCENCAIGRYANASGASACNFCPSGYVANSTVACVACPTGSSSQRGELTCTDCSPGKFATAGFSSCQLCLPGSYNVFYGATACVECDSNTFSSLPGTESCLPCPPGRSNDMEGSSSCELCVPGTFSRGTGQSCMSCPHGIFDLGVVCSSIRGSHAPRYGATVCLPCPFLTCSGWDGNGATPNSFDTSRCFASLGFCSAGKYSVPYQVDAIDPGCMPCPAGKFYEKSNDNNIACDSCLDGFINSGTPQLSNCTPCPKGTYSDGVTCIRCDSGSFAPDIAMSRCALCPPGRLSSSDFMTCTTCSAGKFSSQNPQLQVVCEECATGRYSSQPGQVTCRSAENGFQIVNTSLSATNVTECSAGTFHPLDENVYILGLAPPPCQECQAGFFSEKGASTCLLCPSGYFTNTSRSSSCLRCPSGSVSTAERINCTSCSLGYFVADLDNCQPCAAGSFRNSSSSNYCMGCPPGKAQLLQGQTNCTLCEPGTQAPDVSSVSCLPCLGGTYQNTSGQTQCFDCPLGSFSGPPATNCSSCPPGRFSFSVGGTCQFCAAGSFSNSYLPQNCTDCDPGTSSLPGSSKCDVCPSGTFQPLSGQGGCRACDPGFVSIDSRLSCESCDAGKISVLGQQCATCPPGTSSPANSTVCNPCPVNAATLIIDNATICIPCVENAMPEAQNISCQCVKGYYQSFTTHDLSRPENLMNGTGDECKLCPDGMSCGNERVSFNTATAKPGYWCEAASNLTDPVYYECRIWSYCLGGATCECADNRAGVLCSVCRTGYHTLPDNSCSECPSTGALSFTYVLGVSCAVLLLMTIVYAGVLADDRFLMVEIKKQFLSQRKLSTDLRQSTRISTLADNEPANEFLGNEEEIAVVDTRSPVTSRTQQALLYKRRPKIMGQLKIILGFFQITSHLTRALAVPWPQTYLAFMSFFSVARIDLLSVIPASCLGKIDYYDEFTFVALLPVIVLAFMTCTFLLPRLAKDRWCSASVTLEERKTKIDTLVIKWKKLCLFTLFALYPTISVNAAQLFICIDIKRSDGTMVSYLAKDVNLRCHIDQWDTYVAWGVVSLLVYSAGIPLLFFVLLLRNKPHFSEKKVRYQLGFVYEAYAPNIWFFEIVDMCHKFLLTCFIFLVGATSQVQLILGMLFSTSYLVIILLGNPYLRPTDDRLHKLAQVLIFLLLLAALNKQQSQNQGVVRTAAQENADEVLGSTFLITVTVAILVVLLYQVLVVLRVGIKRVLNKVRNKQAEQAPTLTRRRTAAPSVSQNESQSQAVEENQDAVGSPEMDPVDCKNEDLEEG